MTQQSKNKIEQAANVAGIVISGMLWVLQVTSLLRGKAK